MKNKKIGKTIYLIFLGLTAVFILVVWALTWRSLTDFEAHSQSTVLNAMLDDIREQKSGELTYKKVASDGEGIAYDVYVDGDNYCKIRLVPMQESGFLGISMYEKGRVSGNRSFEFYACDGNEMLVDGKDISEYEPVETGIALPWTERLGEKGSDIPVCSRYLLTGLFEYPVVEAKDAQTACVDLDGTVLYLAVPPEDECAAVRKRMTEFAKHYSKYITSDDVLSSVLPYLSKGTPIYNQLLWLLVGYYPAHTAVELGDFVFSDFVSYSPDYMSVRLDYKYVVQGLYRKEEYTPQFDLFLHRENGIWQIIEMYVKE